MAIVNNTFSGNSATGNGGAIEIAAGTLNVTNSTFYENSAAPDGGYNISDDTHLWLHRHRPQRRYGSAMESVIAIWRSTPPGWRTTAADRHHRA